jgi:predicted NAD-dependent protein-ADP-ribosyltransferase YbiA (DUF1768 family)
MGGPCLMQSPPSENKDSNDWIVAPPCTDNFQIRPFYFDGVKYHSTEHAYQTAKFPPSSEAHTMMINVVPKEEEEDFEHGNRCWAEAHNAGVPFRPDDNALKIVTMLAVNRAKYDQHADLRAQLLSTGDAQLRGCASTNWEFNGERYNWSYWNGLVQMLIREEIRPLEDRNRNKIDDFCSQIDAYYLVDGKSCNRCRDSEEAIQTLCTSEGGGASEIENENSLPPPPQSATMNKPITAIIPHQVVCIGDLHGCLKELESLWSHLEEKLGLNGLRESTVIFLGDYVDRGPHSKETLDWLIHIKASRKSEENSGGTFFICGNHDFAFASFLGILPDTGATKEDLKKSGDYEASMSYFMPPENNFETCSGGGMHYQGRRWGASWTYDADATFASYGAGPFDSSDESYVRLCEAVPKEHKEFLQNLDWVLDMEVAFEPGRLVCVHAGLEHGVPAQLQIDALKTRDYRNLSLYEGTHNTDRIEALSGRNNVRALHPDLKKTAILVSGHHSKCEIIGDRIIMDMCGGNPSRSKPLSAILLPSREIVSSS